MDSSPGGLSPADLDAWARTVAAEDPKNPLAVASVIGNRMAAGGYGGSPTAVVRAPGQFEVWQNGRAQAISPNSPEYKNAMDAVNAVASGQASDPTGGATHFYSPAGQVALAGDGRQITPSWAKNQTATIGGQLYFAPNGSVQRPMNVSPDDVFSELTKNAQSKADAATATPAASPDDVFKELATHAQQNVKAAPATPAATTPPSNPGVQPPVQAPATPPNTGDASAAVGAGIINGVPVAGPAAMWAVEHGLGGVRALQEGVPYAQGLKEVQDFTGSTAAAHPYATMAGNALGATATMLPLMATAPAAFGIDAASGAGAVAAGVGSGAAIGGTDAAVRSGGNPTQTGVGALVGGATGGLGPAVGKVVGYGANKLMGLASDLTAKSSTGISASTRNLLLDVINQDGPQAVQQQLHELGPQGMLADVGSAVQGRAQGVAVRPGGAELVQAIKDRAEGANGRIRDAVDQLGPAEDPQTVTDTIKTVRKAQDDANYAAVRQNAPPVDVSNVVSLIDRQLGPGGAEGAQKTALQNLRDKLVKAPAQPAAPPQESSILDASGNPVMTPGAPAQPAKLQDAFNNLHNIRQEIDGLIDNSAPGLGVEKGAVNRQQGSLVAVRGALDDALKTQVPGMAEADAASAALAKRAEAVQAGVDTLGSGKTTPTPERFIADFNNKSVGEQIAQAKGLLGEVNRLVGTKANDLGAMRTALQGEEGWNTAKMGRVLGEQPTNALLDAVNRETTFGSTYNKVVGNAQTAFRNQGSSALDKASPFGVDMDVSKVSTPGAILGSLKGAVYNPLIKFLASTDTTARDAELAKILSAQGPARDAFVNKLFQAAGRSGVIPAWSRALGKAGNALTSGAQEPYRLAH